MFQFQWSYSGVIFFSFGKSISNCLLFIYRHTIDVFILTFSLITLVNCSLDFLDSLEFSTLMITLLQNKNNFIFFLSYLYFFFLPYCANQESITMLSRSGRGRYLCFILNLRRKSFNFSPLIMIVIVDFFVYLLSS